MTIGTFIEQCQTRFLSFAEQSRFACLGSDSLTLSLLWCLFLSQPDDTDSDEEKSELMRIEEKLAKYDNAFAKEDKVEDSQIYLFVDRIRVSFLFFSL
jgi:hypothetical protein